jgi:hypothetical protein
MVARSAAKASSWSRPSSSAGVVSGRSANTSSTTGASAETKWNIGDVSCAPSGCFSATST